MTSTASCFSVSGALIRENLRRFWALPVLSFIVYFLSGIFPILLQHRDLSRSAHMIQNMLENQQFFFMAVHLLAPVIGAVALYRYLQGVSSVAIMHAMPFTRQKLFNSNFLSGLILILAPIIATGLILLCLSTPVYFEGNPVDMAGVNVFSAGAIFRWVWESALIVCVLFSVAVFAGVVTGNAPLHFITALCFNFLIPGLYVILTWYCKEYLFGFTSVGSWTEIGMGISPYINVINHGGAFSGVATVWYLCVFAGMTLISSLLYRRRKLERAGDAFTFGLMAPIIEFLLAYMVMTLLGYYFDQLMDEEIYAYLGYAGGAVLGFLIGRMVTQKSFRIFNGVSLKRFLIYVIAALVFFAVMGFDLTGFEKRVPPMAKVEGVGFTNGFEQERAQWAEEALTAPENLAAMEDFHRSIAENREFVEDFENGYTVPITINYELKNGGTLNRRYQVPYTFIRESLGLKALMESPEYKGMALTSESAQRQPAAPFMEIEGKELVLRYASFYSSYNNGRERMELTEQDKEEFEELRRCVTTDYQARSFEEQISIALPYGNLEIEYGNEDPEAISTRTRPNDYRYFSVNVGKDSVNTLQWLRHQGYGNLLELAPENVRYASVVQMKDGQISWEGGEEEYYEKYAYEVAAVDTHTVQAESQVAGPDVAVPVSEEGRLVTTDWGQVQELLALAETRAIDDDNHYFVTVVMDGEYNTLTFYLNEERVPEFVTAYFR